MFIFDTEALRSDILLHEGKSRLTYHEYASFIKGRSHQFQTGGAGSGPGDVSRSVESEDGLGDGLFDLALRQGHGLARDGEVRPLGDRIDPALQGRSRHIICRRRGDFRSDEIGSYDGLNITETDFNTLDLHPATIQYVRRVTAESMFWDRRHENLSIILSFSSDPRPPYDFLSFNYSIPDRTATMLMRQSYDPHLHDIDELEQYGERMEACEAHWAHPLVMPVIMLQVQFSLSERALAENHKDIINVEQDVERMAGFETIEDLTGRRGRSSLSTSGSGAAPTPPKRPTELMKNAHDAFKKSIKLLDTISWMERATQLLLQAGDALDEVRYESENDVDLASPDFQNQFLAAGRTSTGFNRARILEDPLSGHWHEIRQYLESLQQLCKSLETDRNMLEIRCKSQIDIIFAKIQQEDNILTARMAVTSTRDSSSLKALAVITAIFMPGDFIASLLGMAMFEKWNDEEFEGKRLPSTPAQFWLYWALALPLTIIILFIWRLWWVMQDRYFRKHLSKELSEERYWTDDGKPRKLQHSFIHDFFYLSARRDERSETYNIKGELPFALTSQGAIAPNRMSQAGSYVESKSPLPQPHQQHPTFRLRQIAFAGTDPRKERRKPFRGDRAV
ncbi:hypothetical protein QBC35DRAFT_515753 [Podospora australis]|uniref:Uncharacterized protein n=1 Tax=Podospora australis TaxID=1536484 RepID=A0AAN6WT37_9PEZI|nr:hypothetical protein QBC35DRAFT_515753 [Podospora australis]